MVDLYQFEYNGLTLGDGTDYPVDSVEGLSPVDVRGEIFPKAGSSGAWIYARETDERHIILEGRAVPADFDSDAAMAALDEAFAPQDDPIPLTYDRGGGPQSVDCVPLRLHYQLNQLIGKGVLSFMVELVAEDPTIEAAAPEIS